MKDSAVKEPRVPHNQSREDWVVGAGGNGQAVKLREMKPKPLIKPASSKPHKPFSQ